MAVQRSVQGHKVVRHNTASTIYRASVRGNELQRVVKLDTVGMEKFTVVVATDKILAVLIIVLIRFLDRPSAGRVVSADGEAKLRSITQFERRLHQSFPKTSSSHDQCTIIVLNSACKNFRR